MKAGEVVLLFALIFIIFWNLTRLLLQQLHKPLNGRNSPNFIDSSIQKEVYVGEYI